MDAGERRNRAVRGVRRGRAFLGRRTHREARLVRRAKRLMKEAFYRQFRHPDGPLGWLVGHFMAAKNGERSRWALGILAPRAGERVLEVGFGPGADVRRLAEAVGNEGSVAGADVSREMVRQAAARNRAAVRAGRVDLRQGSAVELPFPDASFDAALSINSAQFWPDLRAGARELRRVLRRGGRAVVVVQPMWRRATDEDARRWGDGVESAMRDAGFAPVERMTRAMRPCTAVALVGSVGATPPRTRSAPLP